ncbi:MAG TPA: hypothetical protein VMU85_21630 [Stellaceae bacterium]|nr:hypothetical protein [Stellaceae bacterium]
MKRPLLLVLMLALAGCDTVFHSFKPAQPTNLEIGKTTYDQTVSQLGKPTDEATLPDGRRMVTYVYRVQGQSMAVPTTRGGVSAVRTSAAPSGISTSNFQLTYDPSGVLQSYTWTAP